MTKTLLPLEQVRLVSTKTGEHILDTYIEESEKGNRTLPDLLDDLFLPDGTLALNMELRYQGPNIQYRYGIFTDPEAGWTDFLKFHQWEGEYLSGFDYLAGDVVSYGNGIIYFTADYPNAPVTPDPHTDPKMIWIMDDAFISAILSEMSLLKSDTQALKDATQTLHDNTAQILIDVTAIESNIEAMELNIASMESNVTTLETQTQTAKTAAEAAQAASELAASNAATSETNAANSASAALGHSNQAEIHKDTAETAAQTAINATNDKYDKTGGTITGDVNISGSLTIGGDEVWDAGNFNPANYLPLTGGAITGNVTIEGNADLFVVEHIDNDATNPTPLSRWQSYAWNNEYQIARRDVVTGDWLSTSLSLDYDNPDNAYINGNIIHHSGNMQAEAPILAIELSGSDNLNNITTAGFYYQTANADTPNNNYPVGSAGSLLVQKSAGKCTQIYTTYNDATVYTRSYYQSWSSWRRLHNGVDQILWSGSTQYPNVGALSSGVYLVDYSIINGSSTIYSAIVYLGNDTSSGHVVTYNNSSQSLQVEVIKSNGAIRCRSYSKPSFSISYWYPRKLTKLGI